MVNALARFSEVMNLTPSTRTAIQDIRDLIKNALKDDDLFDAITPYIQPPGHAGNRQMDQALVAEMLFRQVPALTGYENLNHKILWDHTAHVLKQYGYKFTGGRVTGLMIEDRHIDDQSGEQVAQSEGQAA